MKPFLGMLGLCARAGKLITGEKACLQAIRSQSACVALLDGGASANAVKAMSDACTHHDIPLLRLPEGLLGAAIGKEGRMAAVVTDAGMAQRLKALFSEGEPVTQ